MHSAWFKKSLCILMLVAFTLTGIVPPSYSQSVLSLPQPGTMVGLTPAYNPPVLKGIKVDANNPFQLDFVLDKGDSTDTDAQLKDEADRLIRYFLAALTVPEKDLWVNLSPYEKDRIITNEFGQTAMGRDLLSQDYILKQITSSLMFPEGEMGKKFWKDIYAKLYETYGTTDIPVDTFNKVWITPDKAEVFEDKGIAFIGESHLKVMLEADYLAASRHPEQSEGSQPSLVGVDEAQAPAALAKDIIRQMMLPLIEKEINEGKNFAQLRQVYQSLILAAWYKRKIKDSLLSAVYVDQKKTAGVTIADPQESTRIWERYVEAFKKGAYNYVKEEKDEYSQELIPRKYFSGGLNFDPAEIDNAMQMKPISALDKAAMTLLRTKVVSVLLKAFDATPVRKNLKKYGTVAPRRLILKADKGNEHAIEKILRTYSEDWDAFIKAGAPGVVEEFVRVLGWDISWINKKLQWRAESVPRGVSYRASELAGQGDMQAIEWLKSRARDIKEDVRDQEVLSVFISAAAKNEVAKTALFEVLPGVKNPGRQVVLGMLYLAEEGDVQAYDWIKNKVGQELAVGVRDDQRPVLDHLIEESVPRQRPNKVLSALLMEQNQDFLSGASLELSGFMSSYIVTRIVQKMQDGDGKEKYSLAFLEGQNSRALLEQIVLDILNNALGEQSNDVLVQRLMNEIRGTTNPILKDVLRSILYDRFEMASVALEWMTEHLDEINLSLEEFDDLRQRYSSWTSNDQKRFITFLRGYFGRSSDETPDVEIMRFLRSEGDVTEMLGELSGARSPVLLRAIKVMVALIYPEVKGEEMSVEELILRASLSEDQHVRGMALKWLRKEDALSMDLSLEWLNSILLRYSSWSANEQGDWLYFLQRYFSSQGNNEMDIRIMKFVQSVNRTDDVFKYLILARPEVVVQALEVLAIEDKEDFLFKSLSKIGNRWEEIFSHLDLNKYPFLRRIHVFLVGDQNPTGKAVRLRLINSMGSANILSEVVGYVIDFVDYVTRDERLSKGRQLQGLIDSKGMNEADLDNWRLFLGKDIEKVAAVTPFNAADSYIANFDFNPSHHLIEMYMRLMRRGDLSTEERDMGVLETGRKGVRQLRSAVAQFMSELLETGEISGSLLKNPLLMDLVAGEVRFNTSSFGHGISRRIKFADFLQRFITLIEENPGLDELSSDLQGKHMSSFHVRRNGLLDLAVDQREVLESFKQLVENETGKGLTFLIERTRNALDRIEESKKVARERVGNNEAALIGLDATLDKVRLIKDELRGVKDFLDLENVLVDHNGLDKELGTIMILAMLEDVFSYSPDMREETIGSLRRDDPLVTFIDKLSSIKDTFLKAHIFVPVIKREDLPDDFDRVVEALQEVDRLNVNRLIERRGDSVRLLPGFSLEEMREFDEERELLKPVLEKELGRLANMNKILKVFNIQSLVVARKRIKAAEDHINVDSFLTRGILMALAGDIGNACYTAIELEQMMKYPGLVGAVISTAMLDGVKKIVGSTLIFENSIGGEKTWIIRAMNPVEDFNSERNSEDFVKGMLESIQELGKSVGVERFVMSTASGVISNRASVATAAMKFVIPGNITLDGLMAFNGYNITETVQELFLDAAQASFEEESKPIDGGIDLNNVDRALDINAAGQAMRFNIDPALLRQYQAAPGFVPVIIKMEAMDDMAAFLGAGAMN